jgi:putative endopeptidase
MRMHRWLVTLAACGSHPTPAPTSVGAGAPTPTVADPATPTPEPVQPALDYAPPKMSLAQSGIVPAWMDTSVDPCQDFFAYACGGFMKTAQIPPDRSSWGAIPMLEKDNEDLLRKVLEDATVAANPDPVTAKLGAFYAACMDEGKIEQAGITPIQPMLAEIAKVKDAASAARAVIALDAQGFSPFFQLGPQQDFADASQEIAGIDQAGLGLPDRKYYLDNDGAMQQTRDAYRAHVKRMFSLLGGSHSALAANNAYRIELALAKVQQDEVVRRDPNAVYHRVERAGLEHKVAPSFPWGDYLTALGIAGVTAISVNDPAYLTAVAKLIASESPASLRDYLTWTVLRESADMLGHTWVDEAFTMQKVLRGTKELPPRWRRCERRTDEDLGELLGQSYVRARFGGDAKARAVELTKAVLAAMDVELDTLPWMDAATRVAAKQKLHKMGYLVGYPDHWRTYDFDVSRTDYANNVHAAILWEQHRELAKIGKPVDRFDWQMSPPTVNAYYDSSLNELALPAGQLQPPFFAPTFHPAVNFGSMGGGTIGHEMTHGFDDEGSQFDGDGNLRNWWSKDTKTKFADATKCIVDQYGKYEVIPGVHENGKLTAGENIADNGGVKLGYEAYKTWRATQAHVPQVDGYTDDQLYFLSYGQSWCEKMTPESLETLAHSNPHSAPVWRTNGVIVNQPGFGPAFKCAANTPMNPGKDCGVW